MTWRSSAIPSPSASTLSQHSVNGDGAHRGVERDRVGRKSAFVGEALQALRREIRLVRALDRQHLRTRVAHGQEIRDGAFHAVRDEDRVVEGDCAARDEELLRRHGRDADPPDATLAPQDAVVDQGHDRFDPAFVRRRVGLLRFHGLRPNRHDRVEHERIRVGAMLDHLDRGIFGNQAPLRLGEPLVGLAPRLVRLVPPDLDDADLLEERVLEPGVENGKSVVLAVPDPVDVIGRLPCRLLVLGPDRLEAHDLVAAGEDSHQRRQHRVDSLGHVSAHDLAAPVELVAEPVAAVVALGERALLGEASSLRVGGVADVLGEKRLEVVIGHFRHERASAKGERRHRAARTARAGLVDEEWVRLAPRGFAARRKAPPRLPRRARRGRRRRGRRACRS